MRLRYLPLLTVFASCLLAAPVGAQPCFDPLLPQLSAPKLLAAHHEKEPTTYKPNEVRGNVADLRLASKWIADAYQIPARVPEEMLLAGHSYADVLVALALMDYGASLNEVLEQRLTQRWPAVATSVGIGPSELPRVIQNVMVHKYTNATPKLLRFYPDVRSGLSKRLCLPSCSPSIPDQVAVDQFHLSEDDIAHIRAVLAHPNDTTAEALRQDAGKSLKAADWLIAATLAKYNPNPLENFLMVRTGEVVEWGDVASTFSIDPRIFVSGPLAPIYAVLTHADSNVIVPSLARAEYPKQISDIYSLDNLEDEQRLALRWLMSLYYKENTAERDLLQSAGYNLRDEAMCLAIARLARIDVEAVIKAHVDGSSWKSLIESYNLDMTGQEVFLAVLESH